MFRNLLLFIFFFGHVGLDNCAAENYRRAAHFYALYAKIW